SEEIRTYIYEGLCQKLGKIIYNRNSGNYLGIKIVRTQSKMDLSLPGLTKKILNDYPDTRSRKVPSTMDLFNEDLHKEELTVETKEKFRSTVMRLLYVARLIRFDILKETTYLSTKVSSPNAGDIAKLEQ